MSTTMDAPSWMDEKQAELAEMDWERRQLEERDWRAWNADLSRQIERAGQKQEAEASRLRAELAVASFVEEFYTTRRREIGEALVARLDVASWIEPVVSRETFARFVRAEAERMEAPGVAMSWGPPTSSGDPAMDRWWVDLEAVLRRHGQEQSRRRYRFHVIEGRVDGWTELPEADTAAV